MIFDHGIDIQVVQVTGDYFERGKQYGNICQGQIKHNVELCRELCMTNRKINLNELYTNVKKFIPALKRYDNEILLEMKGIAEGAQVKLEDIVLLNVRSELMNKLWGINTIHEGCSTFSIKSKNENKTFVAQTWDWLKMSQDKMIILVEKNELNNETFLTITEAGIIGNVGINSNGVSTFLNYISVLETTYLGIPYHVLLRRALEAKDLFDLQREIIKSPISFAVHIMSCDLNQQVKSCELTSTGIDMFEMDEDYLLHTNHIISNKLKCRRVINELYNDSNKRYSLLEQKIAQLIDKRSITVDDIYDVLSTHSFDASICKHFSDDGSYEVGTIFSMIVEYEIANNPKLYLSFGETCNNSVKEIDIYELWDF